MKLDAYFERIEYGGPAAKTEQVLRMLHRLHPMAIPFENLNAFLGLPVPLDDASLEAKLVHRRRGGYCFEQNRLFAAALEAIGFDVTPLAARVNWGLTGEWVNPRTHMVLLVAVESKRFICDVGFGGLTPTAPIEYRFDVVQQTPHEPYKLVKQDAPDIYGPASELQVLVGADWLPMYEFDLQPQLPSDYKMANHYVTTHPDSHFRERIVVGKAGELNRIALRDNVLTRFEPDGTKTDEELMNAADIQQVLFTHFGIEVPANREFDLAAKKLLQRLGSGSH